MTDSVVLHIDGHEDTSLTREVLEGIARAVDANSLESRPTWPSVLVAGKSLDALRLIAEAVDAPVDELAKQTVIDALQRLKLDVYINGELIEADRALPVDVETPADVPYEATISTALAVKLQRHAGKWVAVAGDSVIANGPTLRTVLESVGQREATVMFVPLKDPHC